ncbi:MAG: hypothetical protein H0W66_11935 [Chthoniobacterales bacterium]|nr:hypothetical protein [Chthoniobacterales bacterium]
MASSLRTAALFCALNLFAGAHILAVPNEIEQRFPAAATDPILPPLAPWDGKSRALIAPKNDP